MRTWYQFSHLGIQLYQIYHNSRLAFCLFCALPPLVKISLRAHLLVTVALIMLCLGRNYSWLWGKILCRVFESTNYTHENTGSGHNFRVPMTSVSPYLNPHISAESWRLKTTKRSYFIVSPTHKRTEGRALVWGSEFTSKRRRTTGGIQQKSLLGWT